MFAKLKLKSLNKKLERNLKSRDMSQLHSQVKTVAFIVDEDDFKAFETLSEIASSLGIDKKRYQVLAFQKFKKNVVLESYQIHNKQIKWSGAIENKEANQFLKKSFDLLIGYYNNQHPYLDFLVSESSARFKVGLKASDLRLFDLQIDVDKAEKQAIIKELKKYLHVLGKVS